MNDRDAQVLESATRITEAGLQGAAHSVNQGIGNHVAEFFEVVFKKIDELIPKTD